MKKPLSKRNRRTQLGLGALLVLAGLLMGLSVPQGLWLEVDFDGELAFQLTTTPFWSPLGQVRFLTSNDGKSWILQAEDSVGWDGWQGVGTAPAGAVLHVKAILRDVLGQFHFAQQTFVAASALGRTSDPRPYVPLEEAFGALIQALSRADPGQPLVQLIAETADPRFIPYLVELYRFENTEAMQQALLRLSGQRFAGARAMRLWYEWLWSQPFDFDEGFLLWKRALLARKVPALTPLLHAQGTLDWTHVVWGGVAPGGIPPLNAPKVIPAAEATGLQDDDVVFGALLNGQARAYPLRILDWHEMVNDTLGGIPVVLSYCPLCGSALLFERQQGEVVYTFNTSGLLLDSNKLMFDEQTQSLWPNLTGEPVAGPLAGGAALQRLPLTISSWLDWRTLHPHSGVLDLAQNGVLTYEGHETYDLYRVSQAPLIPVGRTDDRLAPKDWVFGLKLDGQAVAFALAPLAQAHVWNTTLGSQNVVLVSEPVPGSQHGFLPVGVRAFLRGAHTFTRRDGALVDQDGVRWTMGEEGLRSASGALLPRVPGETAYWFAWSAFYPDAELRVPNPGG